MAISIRSKVFLLSLKLVQLRLMLYSNDGSVAPRITMTESVGERRTIYSSQFGGVCDRSYQAGLNLKIKARGQKVNLGSETDQRAIMMGLMLYVKGKQLLRKQLYKDVLEVLSMGEEGFSLCDPLTDFGQARILLEAYYVAPPSNLQQLDESINPTTDKEDTPQLPRNPCPIDGSNTNLRNQEVGFSFKQEILRDLVERNAENPSMDEFDKDSYIRDGDTSCLATCTASELDDDPLTHEMEGEGDDRCGKTIQVTQYLAEAGYTTKGKIGSIFRNSRDCHIFLDLLDTCPIVHLLCLCTIHLFL